jgi:MFS family permease
MFINSKDQLWLLYVIAFAQSSVGTFFTPARSAIIPNLVPENGLMTANGLSQITAVMVRVLGVGASGILVGIFDVFWPAFAVDSATFFLSLLFIAQIQFTQPPSVETASTPPQGKGIQGVWQELKRGVLVIFQTRVLLGSLVAAGVAMFGLGAVNILLVPLIVNDLGLNETWFGALEFSQAFSMIASGSIVGYLATRFRPTRMISFGMVGIGIAVAFMAAVSHAWQLMLILFAIGWFLTPLQASIATLMQTAVPDHLRGRTGAALGTLIQTANLFSMALAGVLGDVLGTRTTFALGGFIVVLSGIASAWVFGDIGILSKSIARQDEVPIEIDSSDLQPQISNSV